MSRTAGSGSQRGACRATRKRRSSGGLTLPETEPGRPRDLGRRTDGGRRPRLPAPGGGSWATKPTTTPTSPAFAITRKRRRGISLRDAGRPRGSRRARGQGAGREARPHRPVSLRFQCALQAMLPALGQLRRKRTQLLRARPRRATLSNARETGSAAPHQPGRNRPSSGRAVRSTSRFDRSQAWARSKAWNRRSCSRNSWGWTQRRPSLSGRAR
jgi:hypothetical protein